MTQSDCQFDYTTINPKPSPVTPESSRTYQDNLQAMLAQNPPQVLQDNQSDRQTDDQILQAIRDRHWPEGRADWLYEEWQREANIRYDNECGAAFDNEWDVIQDGSLTEEQDVLKFTETTDTGE